MVFGKLARKIPAIRRLHEQRDRLKEELLKARALVKKKDQACRQTKDQLRALKKKSDLQIAAQPLQPLTDRLERHGIELVLDVGANRGQYGGSLRRAGYGGKIISFEPLTEAFSKLQQTCAEDEDWSCCRLGLGERDGDSTINISANSVSSSFLPARDWATEVQPRIAFIGQEVVPVRRLDNLVPELTKATRIFLKIDAQGFERPVLMGAEGVLDRIALVQLELSYRAAYEGQLESSDMIDFMRQRGFEPVMLWPGWTDPNGFLRESDMVFARSLDAQPSE